MEKEQEKGVVYFVYGMLAKGYEKGAKSAAENIRDSDGESRQALQLAKGYLEFCKQNRIKYKGLNWHKI